MQLIDWQSRVGFFHGSMMKYKGLQVFLDAETSRPSGKALVLSLERGVCVNRAGMVLRLFEMPNCLVFAREGANWCKLGVCKAVCWHLLSATIQCSVSGQGTPTST